MRLTLPLIALVLSVSVRPALAQEGYGSSTRDTMTVREQSSVTLRPFIIEETFRLWIDGQEADTTVFTLDSRRGLLLVPSTSDSQIVVQYRYLPIRIQSVTRADLVRSIGVADSTGYAAEVTRSSVQRPSQERYSPALTRSGTVTRGIIAGNNQDVAIESGLRMSLAGEVLEGVHLKAILTDQNTPILPEGTTQRLDEFDKVAIEITSDRGIARLGDFDLSYLDSRYARLNRKLQGASVSAKMGSTGSLDAFDLNVAGATSRGTYRTQNITPVDGVQGPYRLEGRSGERFILLVPDSEIVYLDGGQMTRGEDNDYIIDYATAEVSFTADHVITSDSRIVVEFQYSTNQFTRTLVGFNAQSDWFGRTGSDSRLRVGLNLLRESDGQQFGSEFGFTAADSLLLANAGDGIAFSGGEIRVEYDPEAAYVQYIRQENPSSSIDSIFVALTTAPSLEQAVYRVRFSRVGDGIGSYRRTGRSINGIVYEYAGEGQGDYSPVRLLPQPRQQMVYSMNISAQPVGGLVVGAEAAGSQFDANTLSALQSANDRGGALHLKVELEPQRIGDSPFSPRIAANFSSESVTSNFTSFDRIQPVEYTRLWNRQASDNVLTGQAQGHLQSIQDGRVTLSVPDRFELSATAGKLSLGDVFRSVRIGSKLDVAPIRNTSASYRVDYVDSEENQLLTRGEWLRQKVRGETGLSKRVKAFVELESENRRDFQNEMDSLGSSSIRFTEYRPGITWQGSKLTFSGILEYRRDHLPTSGGILSRASQARTARAFLTYTPSKNFETEATIGLRNLDYEETFRISEGLQDKSSVVLRWSGSARPFERGLATTWSYDARTERTPKLQEFYIRTGPELGNYVWVDDNGDGAIQVEEFVLETTPNEGTYVKSFVPSDSLFPVINVQARVRIDSDLSRLVGEESNAARWLRNVQTRTSLAVSEKNARSDIRKIYFLNLAEFRDAQNTLAGRVVVQQEVFLFRRNPDYGLDYSYFDSRSLTDLAAGLESRTIRTHRLNGNMRQSQRLRWGFEGSFGRNTILNQSFATRNFDIDSWSVAPSATYLFSSTAQITFQPSYSRKIDGLGDRSSTIAKFPLEGRLIRARRAQIFARFEIADISVSGSTAGLTQFELTDGRGPGRSYLWSANIQYSLTKLLRATLAYDARVPASGRAIHTGRMQLSATF